jgi:hypothetical protein
LANVHDDAHRLNLSVKLGRGWIMDAEEMPTKRRRILTIPCPFF